MATEYAAIKDNIYQPRKYKNITDDEEEYICVLPTNYVVSRTCQHSGVAPTQA